MKKKMKNKSMSKISQHKKMAMGKKVAKKKSKK